MAIAWANNIGNMLFQVLRSFFTHSFFFFLNCHSKPYSHYLLPSTPRVCFPLKFCFQEVKKLKREANSRWKFSKKLRKKFRETFNLGKFEVKKCFKFLMIIILSSSPIWVNNYPFQPTGKWRWKKLLHFFWNMRLLANFSFSGSMKLKFVLWN